MKDIPKPILIGLVVVLVLFILFVVIGVSIGDEPAGGDPSPGWTDGLRDALVNDRPVRPEEVSSGCFTSGSFQFSGSCSATIVRSDDRVRRVRLQLEAGVVSIEFHQLDPDTTRSLDMPGDDTVFDLDIFREGADFTFSCGFGPCRVAVLEPPPPD